LHDFYLSYFLFKLLLFSKRLSGAAMTYGSSNLNSSNNSNNDQIIYNSTTTNSIIQRAHNNFAMNQYNSSSNTSTRRSWSTFAFNNKNFPDGKLTYEQNATGNNGGTTTYTKLYLTDNSDLNKFGSHVRDKFSERTNQDVMARASTILL
jgi:hypothetical protein